MNLDGYFGGNDLIWTIWSLWGVPSKVFNFFCIDNNLYQILISKHQTKHSRIELIKATHFESLKDNFKHTAKMVSMKSNTI